MALSQSALSDLLDAFRAGDGVDLVRESVRMVMQKLRHLLDQAKPAVLAFIAFPRAH